MITFLIGIDFLTDFDSLKTERRFNACHKDYSAKSASQVYQ